MIIDYTGIVKADIGIKDGRIIGIGKAGNPNSMDGVDQDMIIGVGTEVYAGEGLLQRQEQLTRISISSVPIRWKQHY